MNPSDFAPMVVSVSLFLITGGVLILRPITKRLGVYLEVLAEERRRAVPPPARDDERLVAALEALDRRLARLEERQEFTDALLAHRQAATLQKPDVGRVIGDAEGRLGRSGNAPLVGEGPRNG